MIALAAPDAKILPLRVLDPQGVGNIWVLAEALAYAVDPDGNPATDDGADVINLSVSTTRQTHLLAEIAAAVACDDSGEDSGETGGDDGGSDNDGSDECQATGGRGALVIAAAGNNGSSLPEYPAGEGAAGALAVGASTQVDTLAAFSNYSSWVHLAAPGENILSAIPGGEYAVWSGTSMATPLAAGVAALARAVRPTLAAAVANCLVATAAPIAGPVPRRMDAAAAVGCATGINSAATASENAPMNQQLFLPLISQAE